MIVFWDRLAQISLWVCFAVFCVGVLFALAFLAQFLLTQRANKRRL